MTVTGFENNLPHTSSSDQELISLVVAHLLGLPGSKLTGPELKHRCQFHDDAHASASLNTISGAWNCKACGERGHVKKMAARLNIRVDAPRNGHAKTPPITLAELAIDKCLPADELVRDFGLHDLPGGGVGIPYRGPDGRTVEVKKRTNLVAKRGSYWPKGKPLMAYGLDRLAAWKASPRRLLVEGESDRWTASHHEWEALGIPGADAAKVLERSHVEGVDTIYLLKEPDRGGETFENGIAERLEELGWQGQLLIVTLLNGTKDLNESHKLEADNFNAVLTESLAKAQPRRLVRTSRKAAIPTDVSPRSLSEVIAVHQKWLEMPDPGWLQIVLAAVVANRKSGDPVWVLGVAPPGYGKTETTNGIQALPDVYPVSTLTEAALLSGVPKKDRSRDAKGGLLREMGDFGILLLKDFGGIMSQNKDTRAAVLAAFREIYDGSWDRNVGADGGRCLHWEGKAGLIGGCTPAIDQAHGVMGALGERFVFYRLPEGNERKQATKALAHAGREREMRRELAESVLGLFKDLSVSNAPPLLSDAEREWLITLATLTTRCRSAVERNPYKPDLIENIPGAEACR
ncbi:MAG: hypothetical protein ACYC3V_19420 [Chloroflexota bacterium]